jgi:secondary thiamine-phosphate synthase enzyme
MLEITTQVQKVLREADKQAGVCVLFVQHTTCGLTVNENADPDVKTDILLALRKLIPQYGMDFRHAEENSDAHLKASLFGSSVTIPFSNSKLLLGRWQGVYLCDFDGPRERSIIVTVL